MSLYPQPIFAEEVIEDSLEFRLSEQNRLAEQIRDELIFKIKNPYEINPQIITSSNLLHDSDEFVEIENFKTNNDKLHQLTLAEITMSRILGFKQIHQGITLDVKPTIIENEEISKFDQTYLQTTILNAEIIRDNIMLKSSTSTQNPYHEDLKTIQEYARISEHNIIKQKPLIFDDEKSKQEEIAKKTLSMVLGYKEISNPDFALKNNVSQKTLESDVLQTEESVTRTDEEFELYKLQEMKYSETLRDKIFEIYSTAINPYLTNDSNIHDELEIIQIITIENGDILNRADPIFELKKLLESDRAEELRLKLTGKIYDETFEDDYIEIIDD